ncbi:hypothetical protein UR09_01160 [Candidatus Nitromaritima sp. SCGC AAA799-A02]|nr:hypothetical protein UR09_01160 [Candidatus Nitromaritima sp. SCGC AAA799-A02]
MWIKQAFRDYYKPKLRRELKHDPTPGEMDRRFEEIYGKINCILLVGIHEGVGIQFYEIARFSKEEVDGFRSDPEKYLFDRFGGGWFKLNFYEGPTFIVCVNFKPKGEPRWKHLVSEKSEGPPPS